MATDIERLVVSLEARTKAFENALIKAEKTSADRLKKIENQFAKTNKKLSKGITLGSITGGLGRGVAGLGGLFAADKIKDYADAWTVAGNKIAAAASVAGRAGRSLDGINQIATDTRSGLTETVDLYAKLLRSTKDVAKSEQEVATATEIINKAFKAGGAAASEQSAGILQLSQALSSGILQGDELRSIRENAPLIAQAIANEFKTTIGGLKQLGADGKLSVERVFKAILEAKPMIDKAYGATSATIADGFTLVNNAITVAVGKINQVTGAGTDVGKTLSDVADIVGVLGDAFVAISGSPAGKFLGFLNDVAGKLNPIKEGLRLVAEAAKQENLDKLGDALAPLHTRDFAGELADVKKQIDAFFKRIDKGAKAGIITKEQLARFQEIRKQLAAGTIDADAAKKAIASIADGVPALENIPKSFNAIIDAAKALIDAANKAAVSVASVAVGGENGRDGWAMLKHNDDVAKFISGRDADANRSDLQKQIDERADKIVKAADKVGVAMTEAAAKIQAAKEIAAEGIAKQASASASSAMDLIKDFEGFRSKAYYDVNHYRVGYGSDTTTDANGGVSRVTSGTVVSLAEADRDLLRRIAGAQETIRKQIGSDVFDSFDSKQQAALTSIGYNYSSIGALPQRIVDAIKSGNQATVVQAIRGLGNDNGGVNRQRRNSEADMFLGGSPSGVQRAVRSQDKFGESLEDAEKRIALLNEEAKSLGLTNPLIEDYGYAQTKAEIKQRLLNDAMDNGIEITPEYAAKIDDLAERTANAQVNLNKTTKSVDVLNEQMSQSSAFGKDLLGGFIQDLRDGKSASEALAGALNKVADKLLDIALNSLFDGGGLGAKSGGGILGGLFKFLFPFKDGGIAARGKPLKRFARGGTSNSAAIFGEAGPEAAVPLPDGRTIPVTLSTPRLPQKQSGSNDTVRLILQDDSGRMASIADQQIRTRSGTIVQIAVQQSTKTVRKQMPGLISEAQYRSM